MDSVFGGKASGPIFTFFLKTKERGHPEQKSLQVTPKYREASEGRELDLTKGKLINF